MYKVVTFGEIMLRLNTVRHERIIQAQSFEASYAGGEANVAVSFARFGLEAYFVSKVPNNHIGEAAICYLNKYGVNTKYVIKGGQRLGVYYLEHGASQRPSTVIYDRAGSSISETDLSDFDWKNIFENASWFHFTGITPAISQKAAEATLSALKIAKKMDLTVSCDLNYRKKLWSSEQANEIMSLLMPYVDICLGNEEDAVNTFGIAPKRTHVKSGLIEIKDYLEVAMHLKTKFGFKLIATSLRESFSASDNGWSVVLYDGNKLYQSRKYNIRIIDRIGGGDACAGALIWALLQNKDYQKCVEFAAAASCLKHSIPGDFNLISIGEVENLANGDGSGRVQR